MYMFSNKSINKDIEVLLLKENKRLKRENEVLRKNLDDLMEYKEQYKELIQEMYTLREQYVNKMKLFDEIASEYNSELGKLKEIK